MVYRIVEAYPGLHLREVARQAGMDPNHAKYHLNYLERHGLVSSREDGGHLTLFPRAQGPAGLQESVPAGDKGTLALLRQPVPLHATLLLLDRGQASHGELEKAVPVARTTLHYHMAKLERAGVVESLREGRERIYRLRDHDLTLGLLLRYRPPDALVQGFLEAWEAVALP
jgi:predicted transcriptional regulator